MLLLREVTERPEAVTSGWVKLVGQNEDLIVSSFEQLVASGFTVLGGNEINPYGNGTTAAHILARIDDYLNATHSGG
jgi:UDP-N-acetylglucosamine 2-epimerase (non-hydrolysing)